MPGSSGLYLLGEPCQIQIKKIEEENTELKQYNSELLEQNKQLIAEIAKLKSGVK